MVAGNITCVRESPRLAWQGAVLSVTQIER